VKIASGAKVVRLCCPHRCAQGDLASNEAGRATIIHVADCDRRGSPVEEFRQADMRRTRTESKIAPRRVTKVKCRGE